MNGCRTPTKFSGWYCVSESVPAVHIRSNVRCGRRLISLLLEMEHVTAHLQGVSVAAWLFNPFTATISTRGSGESLVVVQLLLLLLLLRRGDRWCNMQCIWTSFTMRVNVWAA